MAGIGFSLNRLFQKKGMLNLCRAYAYAGAVAIGPMVMGVCLLLGISFVSQVAGMPQNEREIMNCMLTYSLLVSLFVASFFNMILTRYISDMLYEGRRERIMPSFFGALAVMLPLCCVGYGIVLMFSGVPPVYRIVSLWFALTMIVVWTQMNYLSALKDYRAIAMGFGASMMSGFLLALLLAMGRRGTVLSLMFCVILAYGAMMIWYFVLMLGYFPHGEGSPFTFLQWFDKCRALAFTGIFVNLGLYGHLVIMYFGPLHRKIMGLFYAAPSYDIPSLTAFFSILITTISFVTSVEVRFYPEYRQYYSLFNDKGSISDIEAAEDRMVEVLSRELTYCGYRQIVSTILFVVFGGFIMDILPLGMMDLGKGIFRILCVGYGLYAIANAMMLILLYFEDYVGSVCATGAFALVANAVTIWQMLYGDTAYFGVGFMAGAIVYFLIVFFRMEWATRRLPYLLLGRQTASAASARGPLTRLADLMTRIDEKAGGGEKKEFAVRPDGPRRAVRPRRKQ
ncbi:MAG: exopolysaccharide Pel transporter PelG [Eubacteriales bacterium]|nr:exopolysaccharide Pel transporter PelG [Eubacteriales bacterium]